MSHYKPDPDKNVNLTIDGMPVTVPEGTTILEAARKVNIRIPSLCDHPDLCKRAVCRLCVVECDGRAKLLAACANDAGEGMSVVTNNERILNIRKTILELILANHPPECLKCARSKKCELQSLAASFGIRESPFRRDMAVPRPIETAGETIVRDMSKCVKCGRCVEVCQELQSARAINTSHRGVNYEICTPYGQALEDGPCIFCGQCAMVCPVGAIYGHENTAGVWAALSDSEQCVVAQISPSMRTALNNELDLPPETITSGKMISALKILGFDMVLDAGYFMDLAIMEKGRELLERIKSSDSVEKPKLENQRIENQRIENPILPMISVCTSGLIKFLKNSYGDLLDHLSPARSPQQNFGAFIKENYPQVSGVARSKITTVSFETCIAKKYEPQLSLAKESKADGQPPDLDFVLTTSELAGMVRLSGIDFDNLPESPFDGVKPENVKSDGDKPVSLTGTYDSEPASGSIMGALLRWVYEAYTGETLAPACFRESRQGIKETEIDLNETKVKFLVVNGLANARIVLDAVRIGVCSAAFIEIMNCPGCEINSGCETDSGCTDNGKLKQ